MANTTNFGWETPDDTDLVKDGALAMRTLGNAIDTSLVDLKGGTTGQVLSKNTNTDMDFTWVTPNDADAIQNSIVDAKGDLISATADNTPARLASSGVNGNVLTVDTSTSTGLKWAAPAGGGSLILITNQAVSSSTTISVNDVFSTTYDNYLIVATLYGGGGQVGDIRLRVGGTDNTTANSYSYNRIDSNGATLVSATTTSDKWSGIILSADDIAYQRFFMYRPYPATMTSIECSSSINGAEVHLSGGRHNQNVSYTGFTIIFAGSVSGQIVVYGLGE